MKKFKQGVTPSTSAVDRLHWWLGRIFILGAFANVFIALDFLSFSKMYFYLYGAWCVIVFLTFLILQLRVCLKSDKEGYQMINSQKSFKYGEDY